MVDLHAGGPFYLPDMLKHFHPDAVQIAVAVLVLDCSHWKVDLLVEIVPGKVLVMLRDVVIDLDP